MRTQAPRVVLEFSVGGLVVLHHPPASRDAPGWKGPATVTDASQFTCGTVSARWHGRAMKCRV
eukprot:11161089-Lingulodinium_polyedra.AAC.1